MQVYTSSVQHQDLKRLAHQPSQLQDDAVLTWPLPPWPVHAKRGRKRRHAVHHTGEVFDGPFPLCRPLFVGGDAPDVGPVQPVVAAENAQDGTAKVRRQKPRSLLGCVSVKGFDREVC